MWRAEDHVAGNFETADQTHTRCRCASLIAREEKNGGVAFDGGNQDVDATVPSITLKPLLSREMGVIESVTTERKAAYGRRIAVLAAGLESLDRGPRPAAIVIPPPVTNPIPARRRPRPITAARTLPFSAPSAS